LVLNQEPPIGKERPVTRDLESRRHAIIRALTGGGSRSAAARPHEDDVAPVPAPAPTPEPPPAPSPEVTALGDTVRELGERLDALTSEVGVLRAERQARPARPARPTVASERRTPGTIPATPIHDDGDDGVVDRASVPPLDLDAVGSRAFDVLMGAGGRR